MGERRETGGTSQNQLIVGAGAGVPGWPASFPHRGRVRVVQQREVGGTSQNRLIIGAGEEVPGWSLAVPALR